MVLAIRLAGDPRDPEEAPLGVEELPFLATEHRPSEEQRGEAQREADGPSPEGEAEKRHQPHCGADRLGAEARALEPIDQADGQRAEAERGRTSSTWRTRPCQAAAARVGMSGRSDKTSGYSRTFVNTTGATRAVKAPPTTPPTDIQR